MTKPVRFSAADLKRAIRAMEESGLSIGGARIEPDGTIVVLATGPGAIPANDRNPLDRVLSR